MQVQEGCHSPHMQSSGQVTCLDGCKRSTAAQDGLWYTVIGSLESCFGTAALYSSPDFQTWQPAGQWASQVLPLHRPTLPPKYPLLVPIRGTQLTLTLTQSI